MRVIFFLSLTLLMGCASSTPTIEQEAKEQNARDDLDRGLKFLNEEKYRDAIKIFKKLTVQHPAQEFDLIVLYNLGSAYEGLQECQNAHDTYRQIVGASAKKFLRLEAMSLLRLSYTQECLGQHNKVAGTLLDVRKRASAIDEDIVKAEIPARLAAAYARTGNRTEAEKYFKEALNGLKFLQVKYKDSLSLGDRLAETLYFMGRSNISEPEFKKQPVPLIKGLKIMQIYLLQAAEIGSPKWSNRAVDEILAAYKKISDYTLGLNVELQDDKTLQRRAQRDLRNQVLIETLHSVRVLRAQRMPGRNEGPEIKKLFGFLDREELRINSLISQLGVDTELTPEAEIREGLKSQGRVRADQESVLEQRARQKMTLPPKKKR